jgi:hypothetical protein
MGNTELTNSQVIDNLDEVFANKGTKIIEIMMASTTTLLSKV